MVAEMPVMEDESEGIHINGYASGFETGQRLMRWEIDWLKKKHEVERKRDAWVWCLFTLMLMSATAYIVSLGETHAIKERDAAVEELRIYKEAVATIRGKGEVE